MLLRYRERQGSSLNEIIDKITYVQVMRCFLVVLSNFNLSLI